ncbi:TIR domain-containing protein [Frankia sp. CNm7]|uniref:TIR domain-containing protein n=1 Tax=Frankia nepalensis TaxID=1836974 RepID=A0A937RC16_9ACTN|nr:TIR domain-containing protein [Frankia nepalensis]MBL7500315.1 TIR domain-containing protein [Frankia nepalensis]MBL7508537.1 TIR domain-containing protein [Frankia nepalensis]MBL7520422.1 TIR domain-containing protein [Frankia nepalensis]MBL7627665.1 TIR domain-containing protein [Frankia nepalensis]
MAAETGPPAGESWDFFLSYAHADRGWAEWVAWQLESGGYRVLVPAWDAVAGSNWFFQMDRGLEVAGRTVALLSHAYLQSVYGKQEWQSARAADPMGLARRLLPVRVEDCPRPGLLSTVVSIDLFGLAAQDAHQALMNGVRGALEGRGKPATEPGFPGHAATAPVASPRPANSGALAAAAGGAARARHPLGVTNARGGEVRAAAWRADGQLLTTGGLDGATRLWDVTDPATPLEVGERLRGHTAAVCLAAFSPDGQTLITGAVDHTLATWAVAAPSAPRLISRTALGSGRLEARSMALSPDGVILAAAGSDQVARLWDLTVPKKPRQLAALTGHTAAVWSVAFSADGRTLATVSGPRLRLWAVEDPSRVVGEAGAPGGADLCSVTFASNGLVAAGSFDRSVYVWDTADPTRPRPVEPGLPSHLAVVWSLAFSPDGRTLVATDSKLARFWDISEPSRPEEIGELLSEHGRRVTCLAFAARGNLLATGAEDGIARLWQPPDDSVTFTSPGQR